MVRSAKRVSNREARMVSSSRVGWRQENDERVKLVPPRFREFDLDAQFDLGEHRIKAGIAGG
jgi:hypothetical protein